MKLKIFMKIVSFAHVLLALLFNYLGNQDKAIYYVLLAIFFWIMSNDTSPNG